MTRTQILAAVALLALGACTTPTATPNATLAAAPDVAETPPPAIDAGASPYGLFLAGRAARDEGRLVPAAAYLGRAAEVEGEPAYLKAAAFHAALNAGDIPGAVALAPSGDDAVAADVRLGALAQGVELLAEGKNTQAYASLSGADQGAPFRGLALLLAPFAAAGAKDADHALSAPTFTSDPLGQFVSALDRCELAERMGKFSDAETGYKALASDEGVTAIVAEAYGAFLERRGRWKEAAAVYSDALTHDADDVRLITAAARAAARGHAPPLGTVRQGAARALIIPAAGAIGQKRSELAMVELRLALRLDPDNDEAWVLVGDLLGQGDPEAARAAYQHVRPGTDQYVGARGKLAWSYENGGQTDTALKLARETAAAFPASRDANVTLANLLRDNDQYAESAAVLSRVIDTAGAHPDWRLYFLRASAYDQSGQPEKTEADLQAALKIDPDEPELLNFQGYFWIDRGERLNEALAMVQKAVDAQPQSGAMLDSLGWAYYRLGDFKSAVQKLEDAVALDPSVPEVNEHLGDAYWRVGRKTEAQFAWRRVLSLAPDAPLKTRVEAKLASPLGPDASGPPAAATQTP